MYIFLIRKCNFSSTQKTFFQICTLYIWYDYLYLYTEAKLKSFPIRCVCFYNQQDNFISVRMGCSIITDRGINGCTQFLEKEILKTKCVQSVNKEICIFIKRAENGCYKVNIIVRLSYLLIYCNSGKKVELSRKMHSCMTPLNMHNMKSHCYKNNWTPPWKH